MLQGDACEGEGDRQDQRNGKEARVVVKPSNCWGKNGGYPTHSQAERSIDPEQVGSLLLRQRHGLNGSRREPDVRKQVKESSDCTDHPNQSKVLGCEQPSQNHRAQQSEDKLAGLSEAGDEPAGNGVVSEVVRQG